MKSRFLMLLAAVTLFAALAVPGRLAAQDKESQKPIQHHHYQLIDMGTFGGPESFVNPPFNVFSSLSSEGITVGSSATGMPTNSYSNFFVCGGLDGVVPNVFHAFAWQNGAVADLGSLGGSGDCSNAAVVNASGVIAGASENGVIDPLFGINQFHAVLWENGVITDLGTFGGSFSAAGGINDRGQVVGFALNSTPDPVSMLDWQIGGSTMGTQTRAFVWQHGALNDLGTLGGPDAVGAFVNEAGQVVGYSYTNSTINSTTGLPTTHPFLWKNGKITDLGTLGGTLAGSVINNLLGGINNRGQVVGLSTLAGDQGCTGSLNGCVFDPFLWSQGKMLDLYTGTSGGNPLTADAINDSGEIVGAAAFPSQSYDAYLWRKGVATDLGHLSGDCGSEAWAINSQGQVVAISFSCTSNNARAFLWEKGSAVDLNTLFPPGSGLQVVWPMAINDRGEIDGVGWPSGCDDDLATCGHAFLLIPCDENHPGVEGCDYSMVEESAAVSKAGPGVRQSGDPDLSMPRVWPRPFGRRLMPWYRGLGAQPTK
jgi:probable HAF family extracellular repeat protein